MIGDSVCENIDMKDAVTSSPNQTITMVVGIQNDLPREKKAQKIKLMTFQT